MEKARNLTGYCFLMMLLVTVTIGCKKYPDIPPVFETANVNADSANRKVLIINIAGLPGSVLRDSANLPALPNLANLMKTGKYSFERTRLGKPANDGNAWATTLTGVTAGVHLVTDSSLEFKSPIPSLPPNTYIPYTDNIFSILKKNKPGGFSTAIITPWQALATSQFALQATYAYGVANDAVVKDSAVNLLTRDSSLLTLVADFNEVGLAGKTTGNYSLSNAAYKAALQRVDGYIGSLTQALAARTNEEKEQWLVMVTNSPGGMPADAPVPGFLICSYPTFTAREIRKTGFSTVFFNADTSTFAYVPNDNELYDCKPGQEFTVQVRMYNFDTKQYPGLISKSSPKITDEQNSIKGWMILNMDGSVVRYQPNFGSGVQRIRNEGIDWDKRTAINQWHTYTLQVSVTSPTNRRVRMFVDGNPAGGDFDIGALDFSNPLEPLKLGYRRVDQSPAMSFYAADMVYFNTALPDSVIKNYINMMEYTSHPYYNNLTGWWPLDDGGGSIVANLAPRGYDMVLNGTFSWKKTDPLVPPGRASSGNNEVSVISTPTDIASNFVYWLGLKQYVAQVPPSWLSNFSSEIK